MGRLEAIRQNLQRLASLDRACRVFGAGGEHGHGYRQLPALTAAGLTRLEQTLGVAVPDELGSFLTTVHGGGAGPGYGFEVECDGRPRPKRALPFPFDESAARASIAGGSAALEIPDEDEDDDWPPGPGFVPIAHHGCGVFDVIVVTGDQRGLIWWCDMRWAPWFDSAGRQLTFLDWYERWLDRSLASLE
jgi:hypothetical protein